jgi:hypothetical protein
MRHDPRQTQCDTCRCQTKEIALARGCPKRAQDFVVTQPAIDTPAANAPRMPRSRPSVAPATRTRIITTNFAFGFALGVFCSGVALMVWL